MTWLQQPGGDTDYGSLTWYIDGSLIDNQYKATARLGVGVVALDTLGNMVAAAHAIPPPWISSIPAAEAWGLWLVVSSTPCRKTVVTDCKGNVTALRSGRQWATASKRKAARIWNEIFGCLEPDDEGKWLIWMPAHRTWKDVGKRTKSDGTQLTTADLRANAAVDELAKFAAASHRTPIEVRRAIEANHAVATYGRALLGATTYASQHKEETITEHDGTTTIRVKRDSIGKPPGNAPPPTQTTTRQTTATTTATRYHYHRSAHHRNREHYRGLPRADRPQRRQDCPQQLHKNTKH